MEFEQSELIPIAIDIVGSLAIILALWFGVRLINRRLLSIYKGNTSLVFRRQIIQVAIGLTAIFIGILVVPAIPADMRIELMQLVGIVLSATIALSSTTVIGNAMAGIMLRMISSFKPGDYITVGDYFGRISEMALLHVEIQT